MRFVFPKEIRIHTTRGDVEGTTHLDYAETLDDPAIVAASLTHYRGLFATCIPDAVISASEDGCTIHLRGTFRQEKQLSGARGKPCVSTRAVPATR